MLEITYRPVPDGVKMSLQQFVTVFEMVDILYKSLSQTGQMTPDQISVYDELVKTREALSKI